MPIESNRPLFDRLGESEALKSKRVPGVKTVLIVLSSSAIVFDRDSLRQKVLTAYPGATVFFATQSGDSVGPAAPRQVDLLIDMTGPGSREGLFAARKWRARTRVAVGRNAGFFRKRVYDRLIDEKASGSRFPAEQIARERVVQREVLGLAGIALGASGDALEDEGKTIALTLPPLAKH